MTAPADIDLEREAFLRMLPGLQDYRGRWALVHSEMLVDLCDDKETAYARGLEYFGAEAIFLIAEIVTPEEAQRPIMITRMLGV